MEKLRVCARRKPRRPLFFPAHWAPNGMVLYDQKQFPARYQKGLFIAFHGSWNRAPYAQGGYNVVYQALSGDKASGKCEIFADGFAGADKSPGKAAHRPTGLAVGPDGALYVADDVAGRIYRIVYRGGADARRAHRQCLVPARPTRPVRSAPLTPDRPRVRIRMRVADADRSCRAQRRPWWRWAIAFITAKKAALLACGCHGADAKGSPLGPDLTANKWLWSNGSLFRDRRHHCRRRRATEEAIVRRCRPWAERSSAAIR